MSTSSLVFVQTQITYYGATILLILGNIENAAICLTFSQNRRNPCSIYLIAGALSNSVALCFNASQYLYNSANGDPTVRSLVYCKLRFYLANVWGQMARYFIVIACIDRFALTSNNVHVRTFSRPLVALWCIGISVVFWHIFPIHIFVLLSITNVRCGAYGLYFLFYSVYNMVFVWFIPCAAMVIFSYLAYLNLKRLHTRVQPLRIDSGTDPAGIRIHRQDRDMLVMLLIEVIAYNVLMIPYPCITTEISVTNDMAAEKSLERREIESFIFFVAQFLLCVTNAMPFYIYLAVAKAFRNNCKKLMTEWWRRIKRSHQIAHEMAEQTPARAHTQM